MVLMAMLQEGFYAELRTREQIGYIVTSLADRREGVLRLVFAVQGTALGPLGMLKRVDAFLDGARASLAERAESFVKQVAAGLADERLVRPGQLGQEVQRVWSEVTSRENLWERQPLEAGALR